MKSFFVLFFFIFLYMSLCFGVAYFLTEVLALHIPDFLSFILIFSFLTLITIIWWDKWAEMSLY